MGAGSPAPLCQQGSRNAAENVLQPRGGCPLWGRGGHEATNTGLAYAPVSQAGGEEGGGGSSVAAGRGGLALRARRDAGTTSRWGEGACRASRRGSSLRARCEGLSGAGSAADAGLAAPAMPRARLPPHGRPPVLAPAGLVPVAAGGGAYPGAVCPSCPARQHRLIPQPSCRQRWHEGDKIVYKV